MRAACGTSRRSGGGPSGPRILLREFPSGCRGASQRGAHGAVRFSAFQKPQLCCVLSVAVGVSALAPLETSDITRRSLLYSVHRGAPSTVGFPVRANPDHWATI